MVELPQSALNRIRDQIGHVADFDFHPDMFYNYGYSTGQICLNRKINNRHYIFSVGGDLIDWHIELTGWWQHRSDGSSGIIPTTFTYKLQSNGENIKGSYERFSGSGTRRAYTRSISGKSSKDQFELTGVDGKSWKNFELSPCGNYFKNPNGSKYNKIN